MYKRLFDEDGREYNCRDFHRLRYENILMEVDPKPIERKLILTREHFGDTFFYMNKNGIIEEIKIPEDESGFNQLLLECRVFPTEELCNLIPYDRMSDPKFNRWKVYLSLKQLEFGEGISFKYGVFGKYGKYMLDIILDDKDQLEDVFYTFKIRQEGFQDVYEKLISEEWF